MVAILPGSRRGEIERHLPELVASVKEIQSEWAAKSPVQFVLGTTPEIGRGFFANRLPPQTIHVIEGQTWDLLAHCDVALAASGTVTMEAALLGAPTVSFYKVTGLSWLIGKYLVDVPFYTMVNLIAGRAVIPELMQDAMTGGNLAREALRLLSSETARIEMKAGLAEVTELLRSKEDPFVTAARIVDGMLDEQEQ